MSSARNDSADTIPTCEHCGIQGYHPALEHRRGCKLRVEFYGGDVSWDTSKDQVRDGTKYAWKDDMGVWMPVFEPIPDYVNPSEY